MARDAEATRQRILKAAEEEFARYGIAGARVDRIAEEATANKAMLYRYFGSKEQLFDEVFSQRVVAVVEETEFDALDLPGYAARAFDLYEKDPNVLRLTNWYILERGEAADLEALVASHKAKLSAIQSAQDAGHLRADLTPLEVLASVRALAMTWHTLTPEMARSKLPSPKRRRETIMDNVRRLVS
ncbi:TetR family transcriptional regulator [Paenarthrobacter sp. NPDC089675]|uniref:TetR family transcriptional regulator n=1 Tax=Paenarthrobacter sp. NPDC089675 TaxID=3364376 RepID=UPI0037F3268E